MREQEGLSHTAEVYWKPRARICVWKGASSEAPPRGFDFNILFTVESRGIGSGDEAPDELEHDVDLSIKRSFCTLQGGEALLDKE